MNNFADQLEQKIRETGNPSVMGLDPVLSYIPESILSACRKDFADPEAASGAALYEFNRRLIGSVAGLVPAVKPQLAYYEEYGPAGLAALRKTIQYAHQCGLLVIADGKRNDIGSTAQAYADAWLGQTRLVGGTEAPMFGADALTVNAWLGLDGIRPFFDLCRDQGKGVYILAHTSNPSAGDLQDLVLADGRPLYEALAEKIAVWGEELVGSCGYSSVGAVVGATWPQQATRLRELMPRALILVPGYGAQGATADDAACSFGNNGGGAIVNASRSLMLAWKKHQMDHEDFERAARLEAMRMKEDLNRALVKSGKKMI
ncbi:MAG TPA: orotidine-5'-phosphate decarboxylase [Clostridiales bacterium]|nr:orotidine-5'-phosphate decarboxylase [Clostridiales bacterium]